VVIDSDTFGPRERCKPLVGGKGTKFVRSRDGVVEGFGKTNSVLVLFSLDSSQFLAGQEFSCR
jgi:hypothetical protein